MPLTAPWLLLLVVLIGCTQSGSTQLTTEALNEGLSAVVYFTIYLSMYWNLLYIPIAVLCRRFLGGSKVGSTNQENPLKGEDEPLAAPGEPTFRDRLRSCLLSDELLRQSRPAAARHWIPLCLALYLLYVVANACFIIALSMGLRPSLVAAVFASCPIWVGSLQCLLIRQWPNLFQWLAQIAGVVGVLLTLEVWTIRVGASINASGYLFAALSPISAAVYKVLFSWAFTPQLSAVPRSSVAPDTLNTTNDTIRNSVVDPTTTLLPADSATQPPGALPWYEAVGVLSTISLINAVLGSIAIVLVVFAGKVEPPAWTSTADGQAWGFFIAGNMVAMLFNLFVNWGVTLTQPINISVGTIFATVVNIVLDGLLKRGWPTWECGIGIALILISVILTGVSQIAFTR
jgi:drug/metabolite transporter (DMT)-like permease